MQSLEVDGFHTFAFLGKTIPGADFQAIVTAKDPVADQRSHFHGDGTFVFDGPVRDAATCVQFEGFGDRLGRAGLQTTYTMTAAIGLRFVRYQLEGGEYLGNKKPVAQLTRNEIGMLAREPQPSPLGEVPLHDGAGIDVMKMGVLLASKGFKFLA